MSNSPGLIDFAIRLVNSVLNLRDGQVNFLLGGRGVVVGGGEFTLQKNSNQCSTKVFSDKCK